MEMNTRLQVEHCVTELIYGVDIVEEMIKIAAGRKLSLSQKSLAINGWAIECRICAEDPSRGFLPSSGRITRYEEPPRNAQIRIDSGVTDGCEISVFYDQMISKLCTHAPTRLEAIEVMKKALGEYIISGITHNMSFLQAIMSNQNFIKGHFSTGFIAQEYPQGFSGAEITSEITQVFLAVAIYIHMAEVIRANATQIGKTGTRWVVNLDGASYPLIIKSVAEGYNIRYESHRIYVRSSWSIGMSLFRGYVNGSEVSVMIKPALNGYILTHAGVRVIATVRSIRVAELEQFMPQCKKSGQSPHLLSPLAGRVAKIFVQPNDHVKAGDKLMVIEAMKMENIMVAQTDAVVVKINIKEGDIINVDDQLIDFETCSK
jgi:propionyl-CoA carboxylase alpha chain